jgi:pectinesterase
VDFIFGNAAAVFDHDEIHANGPGYLTAQSRTSAEQSTGYVIVDSKVTSKMEQDLTPNPEAPKKDAVGLGRPWRPYSRVVYIRTELPADIIPDGWSSWGRMSPDLHAYYAEHQDSGPGANSAARVPWSHQLSAKDAAQYMPKVFLAGKDHWDPVTAASELP